MKHQNTKSLSTALTLLTLAFVMSSCVSVQLPGAKSAKASGISFQKPTGFFKAIETETSDQAWQSTKSGNTLAFLSECQPAIENSLQTLESESLSALTNSRIIKTEKKEYNGRESSYSIAEGIVDGVPVSVALLVFKKNGCNFTMTYSGRKSMFESEFTQFESFKQSFKVP